MTEIKWVPVWTDKTMLKIIIKSNLTKLKKLREDIADSKYSFKFLIPYRSLGEKLRSILGEIEIFFLPLEQGFIDEDQRIIYLTESEIFGEIKRRKK